MNCRSFLCDPTSALGRKQPDHGVDMGPCTELPGNIGIRMLRGAYQ